MQMGLEELTAVGSEEKAKLSASLSPRIQHGGKDSRGKRKSPRPFTSNAPIHIVLRSARAKGRWSLLHRKNKASVGLSVYHYAKIFKVKVYRFSNTGDQIQLLVKASEKKQLQDYLRVLAGRVVIHVTGARKYVKRLSAHPDAKNKRKFWDHLCWSRLVNWGKDFFNTTQTVFENELQEFSKSRHLHANLADNLKPPD